MLPPRNSLGHLKMADWKIRDAQDVAEALDWLRRRMQGRGLVLVAIGENSVAYAKEANVSPEDAAALIESQMMTLRRGFYELRANRVTRGFRKREV